MGDLRPAGSRAGLLLTGGVLLALLFGLAGCEEASVEPDPIGSVPVVPGLVDSVQVPEFWVLGSEEYRQLHFALELTEEEREAVRTGAVTQPLVWVYLTPPSGDEELFQLYDDGGAQELTNRPDYVADHSGDVVPGDFVFGARVNAGFADAEGTYTFGIAVDGLRDPTLPSPEVLPQPIVEVEVTVSANEPPVVGDTTVPDSLRAGFEPQQWTVAVTDPNEASNDEVVEVMVELSAGATVYRELLFAQGQDSLWTFSADSTFAAGLPTNEYTMTFTASDRFEQVSEPVEHMVWVENLAPVLMSAEAPDTVQQPEPDAPPNVYAFTLEVTDSQGQGDIEEVYYTVIDPTGNFFESDEFVFRDDGEDIDPVAGDGVWNHGFRVDPTVSNFGTYTFTFYARDRAGQVSDPIAVEVELIASGGPQP